MCKYYFSLLFLAISLIQVTAQTNRALITEALTKAKEQNKYIFVNYRSTSCDLSEKMNVQMNNETCKSLFDDNYIVVDILVPKEKAASYFQKSSIVSEDKNEIKSSGFPFWYILDSHGNFIEVSMNVNDESVGYPITEKEVDDFIGVVRKTSKLSEANLDMMANSFNAANSSQLLSSK